MTPVTPGAGTPGQAAYEALKPWEQLAQREGMLLTVLEGMVPLAMLELARYGGWRLEEEVRQLADIVSLADSLVGDADPPSRGDMKALPPLHLWAGKGAARSYRRGEVLAAVARGLALVALRPGGVTFAGRHWCAAPHEGCPQVVAA